MTPQEKLRRDLDALPVFPLPDVVLLPYEMIPLNVFEPRYRRLVEDLLETKGHLGLVRLAPGEEAGYEGRPALERRFGVGHIVRHERQDDGRFHILVRGVARAELVEELPSDHPYRLVRARLTEDLLPEAFDEEGASERLRRMVFALCSSKAGPGANALAQLASQTSGAGPLADAIVAALVTDLVKRQASLEADDVAVRVGIAEAAVAELLVGRVPTSESRLRN
jgi:Lon protease-like protein